MACEIKDEQYGLAGAEQYYFPYLISAEHEQSVMEQITMKGASGCRQAVMNDPEAQQPGQQQSYTTFSNSLIIHEEKTKEITTVKEAWICDPNYHKIQ